MNKFDSKIDEIMESCAGKFSGGLQRALFSNGNGFSAKTVKKECDKCGLLMPKYAGRYPKACPICGDVVDDNDKEVEVNEDIEDTALLEKGKSYLKGTRVETSDLPITKGSIISKSGEQGDLFLIVKWDDGTKSQIHQIKINHEGTFDAFRAKYK